MSITSDPRQPDPKRPESRLAIRSVIWGTFTAGLVIWGTPPFAKSPKHRTAANALSRSRFKARGNARRQAAANSAQPFTSCPSSCPSSVRSRPSTNSRSTHTLPLDCAHARIGTRALRNVNSVRAPLHPLACAHQRNDGNTHANTK